MQLILSGNSNFIVKIKGNITEKDFNIIKPLRDLMNNFSDNNTYLEELFYTLYKVQLWAKSKKYKLSIQANKIFKIAYYFFCKSKKYE